MAKEVSLVVPQPCCAAGPSASARCPVPARGWADASKGAQSQSRTAGGGGHRFLVIVAVILIAGPEHLTIADHGRLGQGVNDRPRLGGRV